MTDEVSEVTSDKTLASILIDKEKECNFTLNASAEFPGLYCPGVFDGWVCWPDTEAGKSASHRCPGFIVGFDPEQTLRKYPSVPGIIRVCTKTYKVPNSNVVIEKGTIVTIPTIFIHRDSEYYPNPDLFDPERFSDDSKANRPSTSWLPFGQGPRTCIAYKLGLMQMKLLLVTLLKRYRFSLHHSTKIPTTFNPNSLILVPASKILVCIEKI